MKKRAVILAGGEGSRLGVLTAKRTKPAVPFAGKYRIIDFSLSNCVNSQIFDVMLLAQYRPHSLIRHIGVGRAWDLDRSFTGGIQIFQPYRMRRGSHWYRGTADAVHQNMDFIQRGDPDLILVLSGDHVYQMNYDPMIKYHIECRADITVSALRVSHEEARRYGILAVDDKNRVVDFIEKPEDPPGDLASMGIYVFNLPVMEKVLQEDSRDRSSAHDFGKNIIPKMVREEYRVFAYPYRSYWIDVGTIESYWQSHMDLLQHPPPMDLNNRSWIIHTKSEERPPVMVLQGARITNSLITDGCIISPGAKVDNSVLSPGVYIEQNAVVRESVILNDTHIKEGAHIERAILDKNIVVEHNAQVGEIDPKSESLDITSIGKNTHIPSDMRIGRGAVIGWDLCPEHFKRKVIGRGKVINPKKTPQNKI